MEWMVHFFDDEYCSGNCKRPKKKCSECRWIGWREKTETHKHHHEPQNEHCEERRRRAAACLLEGKPTGFRDFINELLNTSEGGALLIRRRLKPTHAAS